MRTYVHIILKMCTYSIIQLSYPPIMHASGNSSWELDFDNFLLSNLSIWCWQIFLLSNLCLEWQISHFDSTFLLYLYILNGKFSFSDKSIQTFKKAWILLFNIHSYNSMTVAMPYQHNYLKFDRHHPYCTCIFFTVMGGKPRRFSWGFLAYSGNHPVAGLGLLDLKKRDMRTRNENGF